MSDPKIVWTGTIEACAHGCYEGVLTKSFPGGYCPVCRADDGAADDLKVERVWSAEENALELIKALSKPLDDIVDVLEYWYARNGCYPLQSMTVTTALGELTLVLPKID